MSDPKKFRLKAAERDSYLELVQVFPLASIRSNEQLSAAQAVLNQLLAEGRMNDGETLYVDALGDLIASYEDEHFPIEPATDADMLRHLLETKGVSQADLARETSLSKSTVSEVLSGKKPFSGKTIRKLADYFHVDVSVLAANL